METLVELRDLVALEDHIKKVFHGISFDPKRLKIEPYFMQCDARINWENTYIVSIEHFGPVGFTDSQN